jgi:hypothetical protein
MACGRLGGKTQNQIKDWLDLARFFCGLKQNMNNLKKTTV